MKRTIKKQVLIVKKPQSCCRSQQQHNTNQLLSYSKIQQPQPYKDIFHQFLSLQCKNLFSRITINTKQLEQTIDQIIRYKNKQVHDVGLQYNYYRGLGWICAHITENTNKLQRHAIIIKILEINHKSNYFQITLKNLKNNLKDIPPDKKQLIRHISLQNILKRYYESLLFEFIPTQYSQFITKLYIKEYQELQMAQKLNKVISPKQFSQLASSLIHYIVCTKNPLNKQHIYSLCFNAYMGTIEWPIVIANRNMFIYKEEQTDDNIQ